MKRDSHGRFVAEEAAQKDINCLYYVDCTETGDWCATCAHRSKKTYYVPKTPYYPPITSTSSIDKSNYRVT